MLMAQIEKLLQWNYRRTFPTFHCYLASKKFNNGIETSDTPTMAETENLIMKKELFLAGYRPICVYHLTDPSVTMNFARGQFCGKALLFSSVSIVAIAPIVDINDIITTMIAIIVRYRL